MKFQIGGMIVNFVVANGLGKVTANINGKKREDNEYGKMDNSIYKCN